MLHHERDSHLSPCFLLLQLLLLGKRLYFELAEAVSDGNQDFFPLKDLVHREAVGVFNVLDCDVVHQAQFGQ